jgi:hypothetical protein
MKYEPETLNQLARRVNLPAAWLKQEAEAGNLPCLRVGQRLLFSPQAVNRALLELAEQRKADPHRRDVAADVFTPPNSKEDDDGQF